MVATAWSSENSKPTTPPTRRPIQGVALPKLEAKVRLNTMAEKAPIVIIPSRPMLVIPEFSL